jgi:hypothetical protein
MARKQRGGGSGHGCGGQEKEKSESAAPASRTEVSQPPPVESASAATGTKETTAADNDEGDDFEGLFAQLTTFRDRSVNLPDDERRAYAEKMAMSFYNAIGGEDSSDEEGGERGGGGTDSDDGQVAESAKS